MMDWKTRELFKAVAVGTIGTVGSVALICFFIANARAAPFLVSDPYPASGPLPDAFSCQLDNGALVSSVPAVAADNSKSLLLDVGPMGITNGSHTFKCSAVSSLWGSSAITNFPFVRGVPSAPSGLGLRATAP